VGGYRNYATAQDSSVGGGSYNEATQVGATIGGGVLNAAIGYYSTVAGGHVNFASGDNSVVPGGSYNTAGGDQSLAAGHSASATHDGSFVWSSYEATSSIADYSLTVRAHGGARFLTASGTGTGVVLAAGGSAWNSISDRNVKENFEAVDTVQVLETLADLPIQTWNLIAQPDAVRHIGSVAQDFICLPLWRGGEPAAHQQHGRNWRLARRQPGAVP
jgi:hypothetical protein